MEGKISRQKRFFPQLQQHENQPKALPATRAQMCGIHSENSSQLS